MNDSYDSRTLARRLNELLLLATLRRTPMHGYQIGLEIEEKSGGFFTFNHGTLYPILHRLEEEGFIAGTWSDAGEGRARKEYALTEAGRGYLDESIGQWRTLKRNLASFLDDGSTDEQIRAGAA